VQEVLRAPGKPLDATTREFMEPSFGSDLSRVQIHADEAAARSARQLNAAAYTFGGHIAFARGAYAPGTTAGKELLAHELAHVVQQHGSYGAQLPGDGIAKEADPQERAADIAAEHVMRGAPAPRLAHNTGPMLQRKIEVRGVAGSGKSGMARLPEFIDRLNAISGGLTFSMSGRNLAYEIRNEAGLTNFDRQMMGFIDQDALIPVRLTNSEAEFKDRATGLRSGVNIDSWHQGYVDVDDLLASADLAFQLALLHVLRERAETKDYAGRVGTRSLATQEAVSEFESAHRSAFESEVELLREFFSDPTIRPEHVRPSEGVERVYRNSRQERFIVRMTSPAGGLDVTSIEVVTRDRRVHTPEEYLRLRDVDNGAPAP
jgi:hypothetical protein